MLSASASVLLSRVFHALDRDGSGGLSLCEFQAYCAVQGEDVSQQDFHDLLQALEARQIAGAVTPRGELSLAGLRAVVETEFQPGRDGHGAVQGILEKYTHLLLGPLHAAHADVIVIDDQPSPPPLPNAKDKKKDAANVNAFALLMKSAKPPPAKPPPPAPPKAAQASHPFFHMAKSTTPPIQPPPPGTDDSLPQPLRGRPRLSSTDMAGAAAAEDELNDYPARVGDDQASLDWTYLPSPGTSWSLPDFPAQGTGAQQLSTTTRTTAGPLPPPFVALLPTFPLPPGAIQLPPRQVLEDAGSQHEKVHDPSSLPPSRLAWVEARRREFDADTLRGQPWTATYRPHFSGELVGNAASVAAVREWLSSFLAMLAAGEAGTPPPLLDPEQEFRRDGEDDNDSFIVDDDDDFDDDSDEDFHPSGPAGGTRKKTRPSRRAGGRVGRALILVGPPGCGKTACVYACAQELDLDVREVNGSDDVSGARLRALVGETSQSHTISKSSERGLRHSVILLDEVDVALEEDAEDPLAAAGGGKFLATLRSLVALSRTPVVLTCNDVKAATTVLSAVGDVVRFRAVAPGAVRDLVAAVCHAEGVPTVERPSAAVAQGEPRDVSDVRAWLTHAQFWGRTRLPPPSSSSSPPPLPSSSSTPTPREDDDKFGVPTPHVDSVSPAQACVGQVIRVRGKHLWGGDEVRVLVGGRACTNVKVVSDELVEATMPAMPSPPPPTQSAINTAAAEETENDEDDDFEPPPPKSRRGWPRSRRVPRVVRLSADVVVEKAVRVVSSSGEIRQWYRSNDDLDTAHNSLIVHLDTPPVADEESDDEPASTGSLPLPPPVPRALADSGCGEHLPALAKRVRVLDLAAMAAEESERTSGTWADLGLAEALGQPMDLADGLVERQSRYRAEMVPVLQAMAVHNLERDAYSTRLPFLQKMCRLEVVARATFAGRRYHSYLQKRLTAAFDVSGVAATGLEDARLDGWRGVQAGCFSDEDEDES